MCVRPSMAASAKLRGNSIDRAAQTPDMLMLDSHCQTATAAKICCSGLLIVTFAHLPAAHSWTMPAWTQRAGGGLSFRPKGAWSITLATPPHLSAAPSLQVCDGALLFVAMICRLFGWPQGTHTCCPSPVNTDARVGAAECRADLPWVLPCSAQRKCGAERVATFF